MPTTKSKIAKLVQKLVRPCFLITVSKLTDWISEWESRLLVCSGQLKNKVKQNYFATTFATFKPMYFPQCQVIKWVNKALLSVHISLMVEEFIGPNFVPPKASTQFQRKTSAGQVPRSFDFWEREPDWHLLSSETCFNLDQTRSARQPDFRLTLGNVLPLL